METIFWCTMLPLLYTFLLYPFLLMIFTKLTGRTLYRTAIIPVPYEPRVSVIIAAYNEEKVIEKKLLNTFNFRYPADKIQIIVASDGSTDETNRIVKQYSGRGVTLLELNPQRGKTNAQNQAVKTADGEILVFSDANSLWQEDAILFLIKHFRKKNIGYVCGKLAYSNTSRGSGHSEGLYWRYELFVRSLESSLFSVTAGNGAIYAVRAADYEEIDDLYCHDLELPHLMVKKGKRAIYEPDAIAVEKPAVNVSEEFKRKVRMLARTWRRILTGPSLYNPFRYGLIYSWMMFSHRLLRYLTPFFMLPFLISSFLLWHDDPLYRFAFNIQAVFYILASTGAVLRLKNKIFFIPYYFCMFQTASLLGFIQAALGWVSPTWEKAESTR